MSCVALRAPVLAAAPVLALILAACGASDSTVSKTPDARATEAAPASSTVAAPAPEVPSEVTPAPDPCSVNLAAPEITRAVSGLPHDPRSNQPWNPEPLAGNYNECAPLSVVIVKANSNAENANTRAVMFHLGKFIPTGVPDTYGFNDIDQINSTGDTVALKYTGGVPGLDSVVRFRWNGAGVELIGNTG